MYMQESIYSHKPTIQKEREKIENSPISEHNRQKIYEFQDELYAKNITESRIAKLSWQLRKIATILQKDFKDATREDVLRVLCELRRNGCTVRFKTEQEYKPSTIADYGRILRQFYRWLNNVGPGGETPEIVKKLKTKVSFDEKKQEIDLMTEHDIARVTRVAMSPRDQAFIQVLYESGARIGEMLAMRIKCVHFNGEYAKILLVGKTGKRWITIVKSVPYLAAYLNVHPLRDDEDAHLWVSTSNKHLHEPLLYHGAVQLIRRLFKRAGVKKRCNPHTFRHSIATKYAKQMTEPQMRLHFGWKRGSDTPSVYTHLSGRDVDSVVLEMNGIKDAKQAEAATHKCLVCTEDTKSSAKICSSCIQTHSR